MCRRVGSRARERNANEKIFPKEVTGKKEKGAKFDVVWKVYVRCENKKNKKKKEREKEKKKHLIFKFSFIFESR